MPSSRSSTTAVFALLAAILMALNPARVGAGMVSGKIVSCSGERLNKYPELKSFLLDHEAEEYRSILVEFVTGREAVLTIYHDKEEYENIVLSDYRTKAEMHKLMGSKGFVRKTRWEINVMKANYAKEEEMRVTELTDAIIRKHDAAKNDVIEAKTNAAIGFGTQGWDNGYDDYDDDEDDNMGFFDDDDDDDGNNNSRTPMIRSGTHSAVNAHIDSVQVISPLLLSFVPFGVLATFFLARRKKRPLFGRCCAKKIDRKA